MCYSGFEKSGEVLVLPYVSIKSVDIVAGKVSMVLSMERTFRFSSDHHDMFTL